jgi:hypothetical protein
MPNCDCFVIALTSFGADMCYAQYVSDHDT